MRDRRAAYMALLACTFAWCVLVVLPPLILSFAPGTDAAGPFYAFFSHVCHQWDSHSLHVSGHKLAVCARCFAVYGGFLAGALLVPLVGIPLHWDRRRAWLAAAAPMATDVAMNIFPWYSSSLASRLVTGGLFGVGAGLLLVPILLQALSTISDRVSPTSRSSL